MIVIELLLSYNILSLSFILQRYTACLLYHWTNLRILLILPRQKHIYILQYKYMSLINK